MSAEPVSPEELGIAEQMMADARRVRDSGITDDQVHEVMRRATEAGEPFIFGDLFGDLFEVFFPEASPTKRRGRPPGPTPAMEARLAALVELTYENGPASVRHIFYRAAVACAAGDMDLAGITKNDSGYSKIQRGLLQLRRDGRVPYHLIVDSTRWMRKPDTHGSLEEALRDCAATYRRDLWRESRYRVEVWCESDSIASTIADVTEKWDVALMVCRGFSSETFAYNAANAWTQDDREPVVLYIGDHDPAGLNIEAKLRERLSDFYEWSIWWYRLGVTWEQIQDLDLPGTRPKKDYGYPISVEAEALPPRMLREIVDTAIAGYADSDRLRGLLAAEESERELLTAIIDREFVA